MRPDQVPVPPLPSVPIRARIVQVGNSVGVRLPASLKLKLGTEVEVLVRPVNTWPEGYSDMEAVGEDFAVPGRETGAAQEKRLKRLFGAKGNL